MKMLSITWICLLFPFPSHQHPLGADVIEIIIIIIIKGSAKHSTRGIEDNQVELRKRVALVSWIKSPSPASRHTHKGISVPRSDPHAAAIWD